MAFEYFDKWVLHRTIPFKILFEVFGLYLAEDEEGFGSDGNLTRV